MTQILEHFISDLAQNQLRIRDLKELIMCIGDSIDRHKENDKPHTWTARASDILKKADRARRCRDEGQSA
jgi:hypothetical protein